MTGADTPLADPFAERALLGTLLAHPRAVADTTGTLDAHDFAAATHRVIYSAIVDLFGRGVVADMVTVSEFLLKTGQIAGLPDPAYLHTLVLDAGTWQQAGHYAQIVRDHATSRSLIRVGTRIAQMGRETSPDDLPVILARAQQEVLGLGHRRGTQERASMATLVENVARIAEGGEAALGVPTGFADLDTLTGGLQPGQLVVVAGRPGMGKSTLGMDIHRHVSIGRGEPSLMFSLEMGETELAQRIASAEAKVPLHHLRPNHEGESQMTETDWQRLNAKAGRIADSRLIIDATTGITLSYILAEARRVAAEQPIRFVSVDYVQRVHLSDGRRPKDRHVEVAEISDALKNLARDLQVPVVALAQLNREVERRSDKRPMSSDLRESGALEQDADVIILLHREDAYEPESPRAGEADLIVAKHRNGPTATITVAFQGHYSRFVDMAKS